MKRLDFVKHQYDEVGTFKYYKEIWNWLDNHLYVELEFDSFMCKGIIIEEKDTSDNFRIPDYEYRFKDFDSDWYWVNGDNCCHYLYLNYHRNNLSYKIKIDNKVVLY